MKFLSKPIQLFVKLAPVLGVVIFSNYSFANTFPSDVNDRVTLSTEPEETIEYLRTSGIVTSNIINTWH